jgi:hypothetical protein
MPNKKYPVNTIQKNLLKTPSRKEIKKAAYCENSKPLFLLLFYFVVLSRLFCMAFTGGFLLGFAVFAKPN